MNRKKDRRKDKRYLNQIRKKVGFGKFFIDCRGHACQVTEVDFYTDDMYGNGCSGVSLIDGTSNGCSYFNCGPHPISEATARKIKAPMLTDEQYNELGKFVNNKWVWNE